MRLLKKLFENNERWADAVQKQDPLFFDRLARQQSPEFLWIGCSDSRVPANEITGLLPGEIFVHRNVGNVVHPSDLNCLSVVQYAVEALRVTHIMVVGHYGCGGVKAALEQNRFGIVDTWLHPIRRIYEQRKDFLDATAGEEKKWDKLCELNVIEQTVALVNTTPVREAWNRGQELAVHGWIYGIRDGRLRDMDITITSPAERDEVYQKALKATLR
jgi:carbonic anhydrase